MRTYTPDKFVLIDYGEGYSRDERYAILGGWYGGFAGSNSWKRSSPVVSVVVVDDKQIIATTYSGSKYILHKGCVGVTMLTQSLLSQVQLNVVDGWDEIVNVLKENVND